jgi:UDP-2,3-diacylglucosamine pyrophosphatase LpxH
MSFRFVHISDLHFSDDWQQKQVLTALLVDLELLVKTAAIDAVIFTGDAAAKGRTNQEAIEQILARFVSQVRGVVGSNTPFLICPGNHDVDLKARLSVFDPIFQAINSPAKASNLALEAASSAAAPLWGHLAGFRKLAKAIDADAFSISPLFYTKQLIAQGTRVGFACLNSAWMTSGGGVEDYGRLYVGEAALQAAHAEIKDADVKIALLHHPLEWLAPEEQAVIQRQLTLNFDGLLCGHKHDNNADTLQSNVGHLFTSNTGCVYQSREYFNGYSIIEYHPAREWKVSAREFYFQRNVFDVATRFAPAGECVYPIIGKAEGYRISIATDVFRAINERANALLLSSTASELAPKSLGALFVEPPLSEVSEKELLTRSRDGTLATESYVSLHALAKLDKCLLFVGKRETGKSMLLHHIAVNQFQNFCSDARLGVVVDLQVARKLTQAGLLEQAVEFCGGEIPRRDLIKLLEHGQLLVCIDNVDIHDQGCVDLVAEFTKAYPRVRFVLAAAEETLDVLSGKGVPDLGIPVARIFVHSFRTHQTKELVRRWFGSRHLAVDEHCQTVHKLLGRLRVPHTPFLVSVLSWVLEQKPGSVVINRASAIEVLVEGLLEKFKESKARKDFDSTIQQHFLTELAVELNRADAEWQSKLVFEEFVLAYFKRKGLTVSTEGFAAELVRKGLLYDAGDRVGFKFDCFRAFFLAKRFADADELWHTALDPQNVRRYVMELDLFTGLHRDRADVLRLAKVRCVEAYEALEVSIDIEEIDKLGATGLADTRNLFDVLQKSLIAVNGTTNSERLELPDVVSADHEEARKRRHLPDLGEVGRFIESLRAFSMILRNSELVDDIDLKRTSFDVALTHWSNTAVAVILATIAQSHELKLRYENGREIDLSQIGGEVEALVRTIIPQMVVGAMCESLATPKLQLFVREKTMDPKTLVRGLAVFLAMEANDEQAPELLRAFVTAYRTNIFVLQLVFFRIIGHFIEQGLGANRKYRDLAGDLFVWLGGGGQQQLATQKGAFLEGLDRHFTS